MTPLLSYGFFLALGVVVSFEDWTQRKIRNHRIMAGLLACAAVLCWLLGNSLLGHQHLRLGSLGEYYLPLRFYPRMLLHMLLSFAAALALWRFSVWPAGDAKFFMVCAFFAALIDSNLPGFPQMLFLLLLINVFVPAGVVFACESVVIVATRLPALRRVDWPTWRKAQLDYAAINLRELWPHRAEYLILAVNLFAAFFAMQTAQRRFHPTSHNPWLPLLIFIGMCLIWQTLAAVLRNKTVGLLTFAAVAAWTAGGIYTDGWGVLGHLGAALKMTLNFSMFLSLGRVLFYWFIEKESLRELHPEQLQQGVVLSDRTWQRLGNQDDLSGRLERPCVDGLTGQEAAALKTWLAEHSEKDYTVYHTIPFALWIFLGTLLTLTRRDSIAIVTHHLGQLQALLKAAAGRLS